jgi:hypothetical protein
MRAEVRLEASGVKNVLTDMVTKCKRAKRGTDVLGCSGLKPELMRAAVSLRPNEHR